MLRSYTSILYRPRIRPTKGAHQPPSVVRMLCSFAPERTECFEFRRRKARPCSDSVSELKASVSSLSEYLALEERNAERRREGELGRDRPGLGVRLPRSPSLPLLSDSAVRPASYE